MVIFLYYLFQHKLTVHSWNSIISDYCQELKLSGCCFLNSHTERKFPCDNLVVLKFCWVTKWFQALSGVGFSVQLNQRILKMKTSTCFSVCYFPMIQSKHHPANSLVSKSIWQESCSATSFLSKTVHYLMLQWLVT